jgi:hypothetical protein
MNSEKAYDSKDVNILISTSTGQFYITDFSSGSSITAEKSSDMYSQHKGMKGDIHWAKTNDNGGTIKFKITQDSDSNKELYSLAASGEFFNTSIIDASEASKSKAVSKKCVIQKPANYERKAEITDSEWTIGCTVLDISYD